MIVVCSKKIYMSEATETLYTDSQLTVYCFDVFFQDQVIEKVGEKITKFYSDNPKTSDSFGRIINGKHVQ